MSTLWTNGHSCLNSNWGQQSSGQYFLTLYKNFTQLGHPLQEKIRLVCIFSQFCFIPGVQMSTLRTNGHMGLKSTRWLQSSGQYFLTLYKNFTQLGHPLAEKIRLVCICSQFCFIPGEHMSTLWTNGHRGLKSTWWQQSSGQYSLTSQKNFTRLCDPRQKKKSLSQHFFTILLHSRWTNVHFMGKWRQVLKIDRMAIKQRIVLLNLALKIYPAQPSSSR